MSNQTVRLAEQDLLLRTSIVEFLTKAGLQVITCGMPGSGIWISQSDQHPAETSLILYQMPVDLRKLEETIRQALTLKARKLIPEKRPGHVMVGDSAPMQKVYSMIDRVAAEDCHVLITGETGTGKGMVAQAIHMRSSRRKAPFQKVNIRGLPDDLLDSELFGHTKGAFTGALQDRPGLVETAHGGSLFLDEIGEMPAVLQAKLLHFLDDHSFRRVGENVRRVADLRLIFATNKDLSRAVEVGEFRADLWHRMKTVDIHMPPLRERAQDIEQLAFFFVSRHSKNRGIPYTLSKCALERLRRYSWPGNIREFENAIHKAVVLADTPNITTHNFRWLGEASSVSSFHPVPMSVHLRREAKWLIEATMQHAGGNRNKAAELMKISVATLYRRMEGSKP